MGASIQHMLVPPPLLLLLLFPLLPLLRRPLRPWLLLPPLALLQCHVRLLPLPLHLTIQLSVVCSLPQVRPPARQAPVGAGERGRAGAAEWGSRCSSASARGAEHKHGEEVNKQ